MFKSIPDCLIPARDGDVILITTVNGYWAKGATVKEAKERLKAEGQVNDPKRWHVFSAHPDTRIGRDGEILSPSHHLPIKTAELDPV